LGLFLWEGDEDLTLVEFVAERYQELGETGFHSGDQGFQSVERWGNDGGLDVVFGCFRGFLGRGYGWIDYC
jgi:hypothetical protein